MSERIKRSYPHVDLVFGPHALWRFPELLWQVYETRKRVFSVTDEHGTIAEGIPVVREQGVKAWVSIMYGCNNFCSYCIVPYVRGRERSRDPQAVLAEVRELVAAGYKDITLLGQNVNSYGNDLDIGYHFPDLLADIDQIPGEYWIRFMSSHPKDATKRLFDVMAGSRHVAHQLHLPFQSGNDRVLREMNRRYTRRQYLDLVDYAKSVMPGLVVTSDVIIGFPGETEAEAMDTVSLVEEVGFDALFTFIYSPRPGTKAAEMPDPFSRAEKQKWFDKLLEVQNAMSARLHAAYIGQTVRVLADGESGDADYPRRLPHGGQPAGAAEGGQGPHRAVPGREDHRLQHLGAVRRSPLKGASPAAGETRERLTEDREVAPLAEVTPMMKQYLEIKKDNPDSILFFRLGDFYEMFADDAKLASRELDLTLTSRDHGKHEKPPEERVPMCGIPYHASEAYIAPADPEGLQGGHL